MESNTPTLTKQPVDANPTPSSNSSPDLSAEIAQRVDRRPGDKVRVLRVWGDHYRCNWIAPKNRMDVLETFVVRQSQFLHATRSADGTIRIRVVGSE